MSIECPITSPLLAGESLLEARVDKCSYQTYTAQPYQYQVSKENCSMTRDSAAERQARAQYQREYYEAHRLERLQKLQERRQAGWEVFSALHTNQRCEECNRQTYQDTQWRHRDLSKDTQSTFQNLADVRYAARNGYSEAIIRQKFSELIPLCPACAGRYNRNAPEKPDQSMLTVRQKYERSRPKRSKGELKAYRQARIKERREWLREQLRQPCVKCNRRTGVTWHLKDAMFDSPHERRNLALVRSLCTHGASFDRIEHSLSLLHPLCPECYRASRTAPVDYTYRDEDDTDK